MWRKLCWYLLLNWGIYAENKVLIPFVKIFNGEIQPVEQTSFNSCAP